MCFDSQCVPWKLKEQYLFICIQCASGTPTRHVYLARHRISIFGVNFSPSRKIELFDFFHSLCLGRSHSPYFAAPRRISIFGMTLLALAKLLDNIYFYAVCLGARTRQALLHDVALAFQEWLFVPWKNNWAIFTYLYPVCLGRSDTPCFISHISNLTPTQPEAAVVAVGVVLVGVATVVEAAVAAAKCTRTCTCTREQPRQMQKHARKK